MNGVADRIPVHPGRAPRQGPCDGARFLVVTAQGALLPKPTALRYVQCDHPEAVEADVEVSDSILVREGQGYIIDRWAVLR